MVEQTLLEKLEEMKKDAGYQINTNKANRLTQILNKFVEVALAEPEEEVEFTGEESYLQPNPDLGEKVYVPHTEPVMYSTTPDEMLDMIEDHKTSEHTRPVDETTIAKARGIMAGTIAGVSALETIGLIAEILSLGQIDNVTPVMHNIMNLTGLPDISKELMKIPLDKSVVIPYSQILNAKYTPEMPQVSDLVKMRSREAIDEDQYNAALSYQGYGENWRKALWDSHYVLPGLSTLEELVRKQVITLDEYQEKAELLGFDPGSIDLMSKIIEPMHSTSSLIEFVVKEVITPEDFTAAMKKQGWPAAEAKKYWDSHWRLVSLDDLKEMRNREYITDETYKAELIKHDYPSKWADEIVKLSYRRPTLAQLRQIVEYTEFTDEEIEKVIKDLGFEESWIPLMRKYLLSRRLMLERTRLITELENQFIKGYMTKEQFKDELVKLGFSLDVIDMRLKKAALRNDRERADDLKDVYIKAYRNDYITIEELTSSLTELGLREDIVSSIVALETVRKKPAAAT